MEAVEACDVQVSSNATTQAQCSSRGVALSPCPVNYRLTILADKKDNHCHSRMTSV